MSELTWFSAQTFRCPYLVNHGKVPKNSLNRNGESELDGLDRLDRRKPCGAFFSGNIPGDGSSNYGRTVKWLRKQIAKD